MPDVRWCQKMFRQDTDVARAYDCMRELNHGGNCDSPKAQEIMREFLEAKWRERGNESLAFPVVGTVVIWDKGNSEGD